MPDQKPGHSRPESGPKLRGREPILAEREKTHGEFEAVADVSQCLKATMHRDPYWGQLELAHRECLDMIAVKIARIVMGNAYYEDHWDDIVGYAKLGIEACKRDNVR